MGIVIAIAVFSAGVLVGFWLAAFVTAGRIADLESRIAWLNDAIQRQDRRPRWRAPALFPRPSHHPRRLVIRW